MGRIALALHGPLKSGKSTLANALHADYGFAYVNFTRDIKARASEALWAAGGGHVSVEEIEADKEHYRLFLIELARAIGVDEGHTVPGVLCSELGEIVDSWPERIVFDNVRYSKQMDELLPYGFTLVRLVLDEATQEERARRDGMDIDALFDLRLDTTEQPLPQYPGEIVLDANQEAERVLDDLLRAISA